MKRSFFTLYLEWLTLRNLFACGSAPDKEHLLEFVGESFQFRQRMQMGEQTVATETGKERFPARMMLCSGSLCSRDCPASKKGATNEHDSRGA
jgi:hypothetical protein